MPHSADRIGQVVVVRVDAIAELVVFDPVPQAFHDVQFGRMGGQWQQRDVFWHIQPAGSVPAGVVQNKDSLAIAEGAQSELKQALTESLRASLSGVVQMRGREGQALKSDMMRHLTSISEKAAQARAMVPSTVQECHLRLQEKLEQLLPPKVLDPQRLAQEVAILAERSDISEEFARLESHIAQFGGLLADGAEIGKKLDFLLQEMQREVNTMLSKSGNLEITRLGIAIKADIEKLREQGQNVE